MSGAARLSAACVCILVVHNQPVRSYHVEYSRPVQGFADATHGFLRYDLVNNCIGMGARPMAETHPK